MLNDKKDYKRLFLFHVYTSKIPANIMILKAKYKNGGLTVLQFVIEW